MPLPAFETLLAESGVDEVGSAVDPLFDDPSAARARLRRLWDEARDRAAFAELLPRLLGPLRELASPDAALALYERFAGVVADRGRIERELCESPRHLEFLTRLFLASPYLTGILTRHPEHLNALPDNRRLAEIKSQSQFLEQAREHMEGAEPAQAMDALRRYQQAELLRIAACDTFHLLDLRAITRQLSGLADAIVQTALAELARQADVECRDFTVLAFGKLGGEELNYSSDIDLVFVSKQSPAQHAALGQRLIRALSETTTEGFLYRVDMRLRPWGRSGPLVTTAAEYVDYLQQHGRFWERQALLKARPIAGNVALGDELLAQLGPLAIDMPAEVAQREVLAMKRRIEDRLPDADAAAREVKLGSGGIRDIEFLTQYLQLIHGREHPQVLCAGTLDGLIHLVDAERILPGEYRHLTSAYVFQRTVEHALQLVDNRQEHTLPQHPRELRNLARRLDFQDAADFLTHFREHRRVIREIFEHHLLPLEAVAAGEAAEPRPAVDRHLGAASAGYAEMFDASQANRHAQLLEQVRDERLAIVDAQPRDDGGWRLTIAGRDLRGDLTLMCGLLFASGLNIEAGSVFTGSALPQGESPGASTARPRKRKPDRKYINVFDVRSSHLSAAPPDWTAFESRLAELLRLAAENELSEAQGRLARWIVATLSEADEAAARRLLPVEIDIDNDASPSGTMLHIRADDSPGFLYELTNAIAVSGLSIERVWIESRGDRVVDSLLITEAGGGKLQQPRQLQELRAAIVLTRHFTHLLPRSSNPEAALLHFRELLEQWFQRSDWIDELASLQQPDVLAALAQVLGGSDFLWEDFLRLQHSQLFPLLTDLRSLQERHDRERLSRDLSAQLRPDLDFDDARDLLNAFKDREMFRIDMRHVLEIETRFDSFSQELTWLAEVVVDGALRLAERELQPRYGVPRAAAGEPCRLVACALGKCGGSELGFASDIELLFLFDQEGTTDGPESLSAGIYYSRLVELLRRSIRSKRQGIFEIDLRLRPHGRAGSLASSVETFRMYFAESGPAWPYERQSLVKLRPIAGDAALREEVLRARDDVVYASGHFDLAAMRGLRERQVTEHVQAGTFHAKLSPGGLVDCEYFVQALQIAHGHRLPELRDPNTRGALRALESAGILSDRKPLRNAYRFLRRLIDGLRMVRGDARDLTVPPAGSDEFEFLARRLGYARQVPQLAQLLETHAAVVISHQRQLEELLHRT
jgi:glutamate-ammonia-ligase adenylyltransferase